MTRRYTHPTQLLEPEVKPASAPELPVSDISFSDLLDRSRLILHREIWNLTYESSKGKLSKDSAQTLRDYVKLLNDLSDKEKAIASDLSEQELNEVANGDESK